MTKVLQAEFLMQGDDGVEYFLTAYDVESMTAQKVMGNLIHESKTQIVVTLPQGVELEFEAIIEPEEEDDDDED